jgi:uncharacterized protein (TIGR00725 family)
MAVSRLPVVGVLGSGSNAHDPRARPLGHWLASQAVHLLTGGGGGVMSAVSRAFTEVSNRRGLVIGILPSAGREPRGEPREGYPNPWVEIAVFTHLPSSGSKGTDPLSRNHINVLSADVLVALPGGTGTASEIQLALRYERPIVAHLLSRGEIPDLPDAVRCEPDLKGVKEFVLRALERKRERQHADTGNAAPGN